MDTIKVINSLPVYTANGECSPDTIKAYKRAAKFFINWTEQHGKAIDDANEEDAHIYVYEMYNSGLKRDAVNQRIAGARAFFRTAIAIGEFDATNPFGNIKGKISNPDDATTRYYTNDEVKIIYDACESDRERAIILLMAIEGLRTIEVTRLKIQDCDFPNGRIMIHGKGNNNAFVYPCEKTEQILTKYIGSRTSGEIFRNDIDGGALTRDGVRYIVNTILRRCKMKRKGNSCHALRHSCGTNLYAATKDIRLVQETLRHQSPDVTARYAHVVNRKNATSVITSKL